MVPGCMHNCSAWHQPRLTRNAEMSAVRNPALLPTQTVTLSARPCSELFIEISSVLVWILSGLSGPGITRPECICFDWYQTPFVFLSSFSNFHFLTQFHCKVLNNFNLQSFMQYLQRITGPAHWNINHRPRFLSPLSCQVTPLYLLDSTSWRTVQQICSKGWWHFL